MKHLRRQTETGHGTAEPLRRMAAPLPDLAARVTTARALRHGLPTSQVLALADEGAIDLGIMIAAGVLPQRTWTHALKAGHLSPANAQRVLRFSRISVAARETFGADKAQAWLQRPTAALAGESPLSLLDSDEGARAVETLLGRIAHGIAA